MFLCHSNYPPGVALDVCILPTSFLQYTRCFEVLTNKILLAGSLPPSHPIFSSSPRIPTSKGFQPPRHLPGAKMLPKPPNQPFSLENGLTNCLLKIGFFPPGIRVKPSKDSNGSLTLTASWGRSKVHSLCRFFSELHMLLKHTIWADCLGRVPPKRKPRWHYVTRINKWIYHKGLYDLDRILYIWQYNTK